MILAGHNRAKAFKYLFEMDNGQKYRKIPALIKKKDEITEEDAWEIIIDTNWVQRSLSAVEKSNAKKEKYGSLNISKNGLVNNFEEKEIKRNINIEVPASVMGKYKNMSRSEKLLISQKLEKIIRKF